jgi:CRP-like cAMP-binding protein
MAQTRIIGFNGARHGDLIMRSASRFGPLMGDERAMLQDVVHRAELFQSGTVLVKEGDAKPRTVMLLSGWAAKQRLLTDGRRQIFGFFVPGDVVGLNQFGQSLAATVALTPVVVAQAGILQDAAADALGPYQGLTTFVRGMMERESAYLLNHLVRIGRLTAYERVIHLMIELKERLEEVGLVGPSSFPLPLTQEMLADALGLSIVHVNRTLQQLRRDRMLVLRDSVTTLLEPRLASGWTNARRRPLHAEPHAPP